MTTHKYCTHVLKGCWEMTSFTKLGLLALVVSLGAVSADAEVITGVTIDSVSSEWSAIGRGAINTVNGSGLSGGIHDTTVENMWLTTSGNETPDITFDLGATYDLGSIHVWNYNEFDTWSTRGLNSVHIYVSPDDNAANLAALTDGGGTHNFTFPQALPNDPVVPTAGFDVDFTGVTNMSLLSSVRLVRFDAQSNHGAGNFAGLSEVQFSPIPEPSTFALAALGLLSLGLVTRRRRH